MHRVAVVKCDSYEREQVDNAMQHLCELLGGTSAIIPHNSTVLLKPNLLRAEPPESPVITNPQVTASLARILLKDQCSVTVGDCPGFSVTGNYPAMMKSLYRKTGYEQIAETLPIELLYEYEKREVTLQSRRSMKNIVLDNEMLSKDYLISIGKMKTHGLMGMTAAVKNLYGTIPGIAKPQYHAQMPNPENFAEILLDLCQTINPPLSIVDGIIAMEGPGPAAGVPRRMNVLIGGTNPHAVDLVTAMIMGFNPIDIFTIKAAVGRGWIAGDLSDIEIVGEPLENMIAKPHFVPAIHGEHRNSLIRLALPRKFASKIGPKPIIDKTNCIGCKKCADICPSHTITMVNHHPVIQYSKCIRCFCCHEICPQNTIAIGKWHQKPKE